MKDTSLVQKLQEAIDTHRKAGVKINVQHGGNYNGEPETYVSIAFSDKYDAMAIGADLRKIIGPCDSGAGCGYRDLQLCDWWKGLK